MPYANKKEMLKAVKRWQMQNKEKILLYKKKYRDNNKEKALLYRQKNKEKLKEYFVKYNKKRNQTKKCKEWRRMYEIQYYKNPKRKIDKNMKGAIYLSLKGKKGGKHWEILVGYTLPDLTKHLESKFDNKMTWNNYGSYWHIDHIKPKSLFFFETSESHEFKKCWALANLQPLEAKENMKKFNKYKCGR